MGWMVENECAEKCAEATHRTDVSGEGYDRRCCKRHYYNCKHFFSRGGISGYSLRAPGYSAEDLNSMTISEIKALADSLGYSITRTKKADIINEFLEQQG